MISGSRNYRVFTGVDGKLLELGRGAMGVTYKALDLDLRRPVALKVINSRYLNNQDARTRFVREARSAASLHSPNVAAVLRLGTTGKDYFYAMEFIQGETLQQLLKRRGSLDTATALEIIAQTANGLKAIQRQQLVHRDIKPANIMVCLEEGKIENVKITILAWRNHRRSRRVAFRFLVLLPAHPNMPARSNSVAPALTFVPIYTLWERHSGR
jgi:serine/threonine protein kinase